MIKTMTCMFLLGGVTTFAQQADLGGQFRVIQDLLPSSTRLGVIFNPRTPNVEAIIANASQQTGLVAVKAPVNSRSELTNAIRSLARYDVDFIYIVEDGATTGVQAIKFIVKQTMRKGVPVFTRSPNAFKGGAFGWLIENGSSWRIKINGNVRDRYDITIPESNGRFVVED